jgi:hypothetical protein
VAHEDEVVKATAAVVEQAPPAPVHAAVETNRLSHSVPSAKINEIKSSATLSGVKHGSESAGIYGTG